MNYMNPGKIKSAYYHQNIYFYKPLKITITNNNLIVQNIKILIYCYIMMPRKTINSLIVIFISSQYIRNFRGI